MCLPPSRFNDFNGACVVWGSLNYRQIFTATMARSARQFEALNASVIRINKPYLTTATVI